jgi:AraC-like DNA-binding protein
MKQNGWFKDTKNLNHLEKKHKTNTAKHILLSPIARKLNFPYQVQEIGHSWQNPALEERESIFPDKIEICLRMISPAHSNSKARMLIGDKEYSVDYPHVLVKRPNEPFIYHELDVRNVFYFTYSTASYDLFEEFGIFKAPLVWNISMTPEINLLMSRLHNYLKISHSFGSADRIDVICFMLLTEIMLMKHKEQEFPDPERELILQIDSYLRLHFSETISFDEIIENYGLSRSSFFRNWARYFDISPAKHLLNLRLQEACRYLTETKVKISKIAQIVNICDPAYFCAVFRKTHSMTPVQYRKKHQRTKLQQ